MFSKLKMKPLLLCCMSMCLLLLAVNGSVITFNTTSNYVKPLVSRNLTLTCLLKDTAPVGPAIGKRSVPQDYDVINDLDGKMGREDHPTPDDVTGSHDLGDLEMTSKSVTQTDDNVQFVTSMVITRDGLDLASISEHFPVEKLTTDVTVSGHLTSGQGERGRLEITWPHPSVSEAGQYQCEVTTLSGHGHSLVFSHTLTVAEAEVTINDLVGEMYKMVLEKEEMLLTISDLNSRVVTDISGLNQSLTSLQQVARTEPDVFFTAILSSDKSLSGNQVLVFDKTESNEGQAYNNQTGIFTSPLDGFYIFHVHVMSYNKGQFYLSLQHNGKSVIHVDKEGDEWNGVSSNSVIIRLGKNEQVKVVSRSTITSHIHGRTVGFIPTTFTGRLLSLL